MMREILENILKINNEPCSFALFASIHINFRFFPAYRI